ncbi:hypothetical protein PM082_012239 [Marasmius tenuissimus]|nr:hypothetical protein PM082_012239 [Marasmius tenuissimus]
MSYRAGWAPVFLISNHHHRGTGEMDSRPLRRSNRLQSTDNSERDASKDISNGRNASNSTRKRKQSEDSVIERKDEHQLDMRNGKRMKNTTSSDIHDEPEVASGEQGAVGRIPVEILTEIFLQCSPGASSFRVSETPWTLGHVCRRWRQVASSTPELWLTVSIQPWEISAVARVSHRAEILCEMLSTILARCAGKKIHVKVGIDIRPPKKARCFFKLLRSTTRDWASLTLGETSYAFEASEGVALYPQSRDRKSFASLEAVTIDDMSTWERQGRFLEALEKAPKLRSITIHHLDKARNEYATSQVRNTLPLFCWAKLVHLELARSWDSWCVQGLALCTSLQSLVIYASCDGGAERLQSMTELSTVRTVRLVSGRWDDHYKGATHLDFCRTLKLPGLEQLEVDTEDGLQTDMENVIDLIERSAPTKLESISIGDISLMDVTVGRLLQSTPQVTSLTITGHVLPYLPTAILSGGLLPNLEHLSVASRPRWSRRHISRPTVAAIVNLLKSGNSTGTLQSVRVTEKGFDMRMERRHYQDGTLARAHLESTLNLSDRFLALEHLFYEFVERSIPEHQKVLNENMQLVDFIVTAVEQSKPGTCRFLDSYHYKSAHRNFKDVCTFPCESDIQERWTTIRKRLLRIDQERWKR